MSAELGGDVHVTHGTHLAAISRRVVGLMKQHYGKGPTGARTYHTGDLVVVLLSGGYTTVEKTLMAGGRGDAVTTQRTAFQETIHPLMRQIIEEELRRPVIAFMSTSHQDPDLSAELFLLAPEDGGLDTAAIPANTEGVQPGDIDEASATEGAAGS